MSFLRTLCLAVVLVAAPAMAAVANAQAPSGVADPRRDAKIRIGGLYLTPSFELRDLGVDTNVFNDLSDPKSDFSTTFLPKSKVWLPIGQRALITANLSLGFVYFQKYSTERSVDPGVVLRVDYLFRTLGFFAEAGASTSRQRPTAEIDERSRHYSRPVQVGFIIRPRAKVSTEVAAYRNRTSFDQDEDFLGVDLQQSLGRDEQGIRVTLRDRLTNKTTLFILAESQQTRFADNDDKDTDGFRIAPGFSFSPRALISGTAEVGVRRMVSRSGLLPSFTGVVAGTTVSSTIHGSTQLGVSWHRDVGFSFEPTLPYYVQNTLGGSIRRQVRGDLDVIVSGNRGTSNYRGFVGSPTADTKRQDVNRSLTLNLGYRATREARIGFQVTRLARTSVSTGRTYRSIRAGLTITYGT